ncbi:GNAT family N-acetyltransferase [Nocardioides hankookensis]
MHRQSRADYYGEPPVEGDDREAMWAHLLTQPERSTSVAESPESVVGFMSARRHPGGAGELELTALYVLPNLYDQGIGSRLHDVFDTERGDDRVGLLEVWAGNRRAISFYERRGWEATVTTRPGPQGIDFVTYRLRPTTGVSR